MSKKKGKIYHALNHPIRREIVKLLGIRGKLGATDFKGILNIGPGKLYYHLENLGSLIEQDEERKYRLSEEGKEAYQLLISGETLTVKERTEAKSGLSLLLSAVKPIFSLNRLLSYLYENPARHIPETIILLSLGGWLCYASGLQPLMLFYLNQSQPLHWTMAQFFVSWLIIYGIAEIICSAIFHRKGGSTSLLVGSALSLFPMILYALIWLLNANLNWALEKTLGGWILRGLLLFFQGWTFCILAVSVSRAKKLSIDRASFVSFAVAYLTIAAYLLTKGI
ncbi:MAG: winged helix-turn-helix domain-containing protein [Candidatus Bathyarchaeia archaeon]